MNQPVPDELISAYFDGEVTPSERARVEGLLESSAEFRQLLDDTSKLSAILHSFPREAAPATLAMNVQKRLENSKLVVSQISASPVSTPQTIATRRTSLRREWIAFCGGMFATLASLFLMIGFNQSRTMPKIATVAESLPTDEFDSVRLNDAMRFARMEDSPAGSKREQMESEAKGFASNKTEPTPGLGMPMPAARAGIQGTVNLSMAANEVFSDVLNPNQAYEEVWVDSGSVEPADAEGFLTSLKRGDLFYRTFVDASNTVSVVQFTVVDIVKAGEEIEMLLQKRNLRKIRPENVSNTNKPVSDSSNFTNLEGTRDSNELFGIYVQGQGDQIAETISESLKEYPQNFTKFEPQIPFELPPSTTVASDTRYDRDSKSDAELKQNKEMSDQTSFTTDANLAINFYAENSPALNYAGVRQPTLAAVRQRRDVEIKNWNSSNPDTPASEEVPQALSDKAPVPAVYDSAAKSNGQIDNTARGYTTVRVPLDGTQKNGNPNNDKDQRGAQISVNQTPNLMTNNFTGNNGISMGRTLLNTNSFSQSLNLRSKVSRPVPESREPRMVRMLMVLKPETPAPAGQPANPSGAEPGVK